jgi:hypothetical protein
MRRLAGVETSQYGSTFLNDHDHFTIVDAARMPLDGEALGS